jgi:hypothetical protein
MPRLTPLLYIVRWEEPSGQREQATTLQLHHGAAVAWLLKLRTHVDPQSVTVEPYRPLAWRR